MPQFLQAFSAYRNRGQDKKNGISTAFISGSVQAYCFSSKIGLPGKLYHCVAVGHSCPRVGSTHGLGWVEIFSFLVGWVGSWVKKISTNSYPRYIIIMFVICIKL